MNVAAWVVIFGILSALTFMYPFIAWQYVRFQHRVKNNYSDWHSKFTKLSWGISVPACMIFMGITFYFATML